MTKKQEKRTPKKRTQKKGTWRDSLNKLFNKMSNS